LSYWSFFKAGRQGIKIARILLADLNETCEGGSLEQKKPVIVAVDGPAGSGKSSICGAVCKTLGWIYINTGLLYRAAAYLAKREGINLEDEESLCRSVDRIKDELNWDPHSQRLWYRGEDLSQTLLSSEAASGASFVAKSGKVREALLPLQRKLALMSPKGSILEGRDIGTVVFPDADLKIFLTASLEERAQRRMLQLEREGHREKLNMSELIQTIRKRDEQDAAREVAPLKKADDAIELDTSGLNQEEVLATFLKIIKERSLA
jgi:cytidylate kinase